MNQPDQKEPSLMAEMSELLKKRKERKKSRHFSKTVKIAPGTTILFDSESAVADIKGMGGSIKNVFIGSYRATKNAGHAFKKGLVDGYNSTEVSSVSEAKA